MKIDKKSQVTTVFIYIIAVIIIGSIVFFGYKAINKTSDTKCFAQSTIFEKSLKPDMETMYSQHGSVEERSYEVPCDVDKVYLIDKDHIQEVIGYDYMVDLLENAPIVLGEARSMTKNNLFLYSGSQFGMALNIGEISIDWPYYQCFEVVRGKLDVFIEGRNGAAHLRHKKDSTNCGPRKIIMKYDGSVISEASSNFGLSDVQVKVEASKDSIDMVRVFNAIEKSTKVNIVIKPKNPPLDKFIFLENIPKICLKDETLSNFKYDNKKDLNALTALKIQSPLIFPYNFDYKYDPQMMWNFESSELQSDTHIKYELDEIIAKECLNQFTGLGFVNSIDSE